MTINTEAYHQRNFKLTLAAGEKVNAGDATFEPIGFGGLYLLVKQFPHPKVSGGMEIEVATAGGGMYYDQGPVQTAFQGGITFFETTAGTVQRFAKDVLKGGGYFDARVYEGTPAKHFRSYLLERCFFKLDPADRDWENRQQVLMLNGTLYGNYFGNEKPGNA
jgi:hypothetical protein